MAKQFNGTIALDIRDSVPDWEPYAEPKAPANSPNILYIVIDDTGFGAWEMFGGKIKMPNLARIAKKGLIYTNFHTTALCSPTRSSEILGLKPRRFTAALLLNLSAFTRYMLECETWKKPIRFDFTPHQHKSRYCGAHWAV